MSVPTITINMDKQTCGQCGKKGTGFYEASDGSGHICHKCVMENIKRRATKDAA